MPQYVRVAKTIRRNQKDCGGVRSDREATHSKIADLGNINNEEDDIDDIDDDDSTTSTLSWPFYYL